MTNKYELTPMAQALYLQADYHRKCAETLTAMATPGLLDEVRTEIETGAVRQERLAVTYGTLARRVQVVETEGLSDNDFTNIRDAVRRYEPEAEVYRPGREDEVAEGVRRTMKAEGKTPENLRRWADDMKRTGKMVPFEDWIETDGGRVS